MNFRRCDVYADKEYIISMRREIHEYPEIGFDLPLSRLGDKVHIGLTACEGINRFYELEIT